MLAGAALITRISIADEPDHLIRSKTPAVQSSPWLPGGLLAGGADDRLVQLHPGLFTPVISKSLSKIGSLGGGIAVPVAARQPCPLTVRVAACQDRRLSRG